MLLQNGTLNAQYPRRFSGGVMSGDVQMSRRGDRINRLAAMDAKAGEPSGALAPISWNLPRQAGLGASYVGNQVTFAGAATGAQGLSTTAGGAAAFSGQATGAAVAGGLASGAAVFVGAATGVGVASADATGVFAFTGAAAPSGVVWGTATGSISFSGSVVPGAVAWGVAGPASSGLTEDVIAAAVWNYSAAGPDGSKASDLAKTLKAAKLAAVLSA